MQKLKFINSKGVEIDLTSDPFGITEWNGFANVELNLQTQQVPFNDGSVYLDGLLGEREISVTLAINAVGDLHRRYELRRQLISVLNPKLGEGTLIYTNDFISKQIKAVPQVPLFENHNSNDSGTPKASLAWTCSSPYWEDVEATSVNIAGGEDVTVENNGDVDCQVEMKVVTSYCRDITIKNLSTGKYLKIAGQFSKSLDINTNIGEKEISLLDKAFTWRYGGSFSEMASNGLITLYVNTGMIIIENEKGEVITYQFNTPATVVSIGYGKGFFYGYYRFYDDAQQVYKICIVKSYDGYNWIEKYVVDVGTGMNSGSGKINLINNQFVLGVKGKTIVSEDLESFTELNNDITNPQRYWLEGIIYDGTQYIGFTNGSQYSYPSLLYTSTDLESWTQITISDFGSTEEIKTVLYKDGIYILGGGKVRRSTDLVTWELITPAENLTYNKGFLYKDNFILCSGKAIVKSINSNAWQKIDLPTNNQTAQCFAVNNAFYGLGYFGVIKTIDFIDWVQKYDSPFTETGTPIKGVYKDGLYVFISTKKIFVSRDLKNFEIVNEQSESESYRQIEEIEIVNGYIVATSMNRSAITIIYSQDGYNWNVAIKTFSGGSDYTCYGTRVVFDGENYCIGVNREWTTSCLLAGTSLESFSSWTIQKTFIRYNEVIDIGFYGGKYIAVTNYRLFSDASSSIFAGSTIAEMTVKYEEQKTEQYTPDFRTVGFRNNIYVVGTFEGTIITSSDLETFVVTKFENARITKIRNFRDCLYAVGNNFIASSVDGVYWDVITSFITQFTDVLANDENYIILGTVILESYDVEGENKISALSSDSDIGFDLKQGKNVIELLYEEGLATLKLSYRQKYVGV